MGQRVDHIYLKAILSGRHFRKLLLTRDRARKPNQRLALGHALTECERERRSIARIEEHRLGKIAGIRKGRGQQACTETLTAVRRLDKQISDVTLLFGIVRDHDPYSFALVVRYPDGSALRKLEGKPNTGVVELATALNHANRVGQFERVRNLRHVRGASSAAPRRHGGDG
jgi:hypothetical protein